MSETRRNLPGTSIHITALDGIINVNSLFTLAVSLGLAWNPSVSSTSLVDHPSCFATSTITENLVAFYVFSFVSFLFSSLVAVGLKQAIRSVKRAPYGSIRTHVNKTVLRVGILASAIGSMSGCGFLTLALVNVVQIKLGTLACGSSWSIGAIVPLVILVPIALLVYICVVMHAVTG